jgi:hypothetical protein
MHKEILEARQAFKKLRNDLENLKKDMAVKDQLVAKSLAVKDKKLLDQTAKSLAATERALEAQKLAFKAEVMKTGMYTVENADLLVKMGSFLFQKNGVDVVLPNVPNYVKGGAHAILALENSLYSGSVTALASTAVFNAKLFSKYLIPQWLQDGYQDVVTEYPYTKCIVDGGISFASNAAIFSPQAALPYAALTAASCAAEIAQPGTGSYVTAATSSLKMMFSGNSVTKVIDALAIVDRLDAYDGVAEVVSMLSGINNIGAYAVVDSE